jgi:preprotein translocase subunit SecD
MSLVISFVLVALFMAYWYKIAGLFSVLALAMNVTFIAAGLALLNATLTLPGIAGITLTIGMAVDANVVIYERIKEELRLGVSVTKALSAAYDKATTAVLDSNITTAIAGLVLMEVGSGPIRGFAVTLLLGIATSLITAIFVTRLGFDFLTIGRRADRLSI